MKSFIRYLYEYEHGKRIRNIGFVKVEKDGDRCVIHIHGKGLRHVKGEELELYLFYVDGKRCVGMLQGVIEHADHVIHYRLEYMPEDVGGENKYDEIQGIILLGNGNRKFAAVWDDMPVNVDEMIVRPITAEPLEAKPMKEKLPEKELLEEMPVEEMPVEEVQEGSETVQEQVEPAKSEEIVTEMAENETAAVEEAVTETVLPEETAAQVPEEESPDVMIQQACTSCASKCRKISRQDLAQLPRCEWKLANNSFLLHGYYNYKHLLLIEEDTNLFLGVPGVFHEREQAAARAFGFPQFHRLDEGEVELAAEERNDKEDFGYWCRQVKQKQI